MWRLLQFFQRTSLYYHPSKGWVQYNPLTGDYDSLTQPEKEPKSKWKSKLFKDEDKKTFDENYDNQNAVDVREVLFERQKFLLKRLSNVLTASMELACLH